MPAAAIADPADSRVDQQSLPVEDDWRAVSVILGVAFALRCGLVAWGATHHVYGALVKDPAQYVHIARHLGSSYLDSRSQDFAAGLDRTPGYPLLLAVELLVANGSVAGAMVIQSLIGVAVSAATYLLGRELLSPRVGLVAAAVVAIDPLSAAASVYPLTEEPFSLVFVIGFWMWCMCLRRRSWRLAVGAGLTLGLATLVRPIGIYVIVPVLLVSWIVIRGDLRRRLLVSGCLAVSFAVPVGGWMVRNLAVTGVPLVSTIEGYNMIHYRAAGALQYSKGITLAAAQEQLDARLAAQATPGENAAQYSRTEERIGLDVIAHHPVGYAEAAAKGVERVALGPGYPEVLADISGPGRYAIGPTGIRFVKATTTVLLVVFYLAALLGTLLLIRRRHRVALAFVALPVLYLLLLSAGADGYSRLRVPIMPFVAVLAGGVQEATGAWLLNGIRSKRVRLGRG